MKLSKYARSKPSLFVAFFIVLLMGTFTYGVGVGSYKWFPFSYIQDIKRNISEEEERVNYDGIDKEILQPAFTEPKLSGELLYDPVNSIDEIYKLNRNNYVNVSDFYEAHDKISLLNTEEIYLDENKTRVMKLEYNFSEKAYEAYSYIIGSDSLDESKNKTAVLIIPGSGKNQSSEIYNNNTSNYHYGLTDLLKHKGYDIYIYIYKA
ncbi:MAG: hypothetical protein ROO71_00785 [Balneola sp.]